ncbi:hypothetical protein A9G49_03685 [Aeromonas sp. ANP5]|nr:hypothetical protein A9G04_03940 [Aeromonas sp. ANNP30]OEC66710.1 hypothetical protein A9G49_03685 [Aeromonas sp. ANP5]
MVIANTVISLTFGRESGAVNFVKHCLFLGLWHQVAMVRVFRGHKSVLMPILRTLGYAFIDVGELKHMWIGGSTVANMAGRILTLTV